jgi:hypothetical protein
MTFWIKTKHHLSIRSLRTWKKFKTIDLQYVLSEVQRLQGCSPALGPFQVEAALEGTRVNKFLKDQLRVTQAECTLTRFFRYPLRHS